MPPCRPSTHAPVPVMKAACLDARNKTGAAASSHVAFRPMGCCTAVFASASALDIPASVARRSAAHQPAVHLVQHQRTRCLFISASALHNLLRGSLQHDGMLFMRCSRARRLLASVSAMRRQAVCRAGTGGPLYAACTRQGACRIRCTQGADAGWGRPALWKHWQWQLTIHICQHIAWVHRIDTYAIPCVQHCVVPCHLQATTDPA